jgi:hypothetical protein
MLHFSSLVRHSHVANYIIAFTFFQKNLWLRCARKIALQLDKTQQYANNTIEKIAKEIFCRREFA